MCMVLPVRALMMRVLLMSGLNLIHLPLQKTSFAAQSVALAHVRALDASGHC